ncbi:hypothetical protein ACYULU_07525 [Breznakiellaceae bacterium SP9]
MGENFEVGFYEFIRNELGGLETRIDRRFSEMDKRFGEMEARTEKHFSEMEARTDLRLAEMDKRSDLRFTEMEARSDLRFSEIDKRFDKLEEESTLAQTYRHWQRYYDRAGSDCCYIWV